MRNLEPVYIPADVREDIIIARLFRLADMAVMLPALAAAVVLFALPFPVPLRFFFLLAVPGATAAVLVLGVPGVISRRRRFQQAGPLLRLAELAGIVEVDGVFLRYRDGSAGMAMDVHPSPWQLKTGDDRDAARRALAAFLRRAHSAGVEVMLIADTVPERNAAELDTKEQEYRARFSGETELLALGLARVQCHRMHQGQKVDYRVLLRKSGIRSKELLGETGAACVTELARCDMEVMPVSGAGVEDIGRLQMAPFGGRVVVDDGTPTEGWRRRWKSLLVTILSPGARPQGRRKEWSRRKPRATACPGGGPSPYNPWKILMHGHRHDNNHFSPPE